MLLFATGTSRGSSSPNNELERRSTDQHCIPFGLQSALKFFNILADLLSWAIQKARVSYDINYLDDYLTIGPLLPQVPQHNVGIFTSLCKDLGVVPLATDKLKGLATSLSFLGIILDTCCMEIRLPADS